MRAKPRDRSRIRGKLGAAVLALFLVAPAARADEPAEIPVVVLETSGPVDPALDLTLKELFGRRGVELARPGAPGHVVARVVVSQLGETASVLVDDPAHQLASVHRDVPRGDSPALFRETLAHVILGAVDPFLPDSRAASTPSSTPTPTPTPTPAPSPAPPARPAPLPTP